MKAIIIAAGIGRRMGNLTDDCPKCLVKTGNTTLLDNVISRLKAENITDVSVIVGYQEQKIRDRFNNITYFVNHHYTKNNILHSLMMAREFMDDDIIISYSDIWLEKTPIANLIKSTKDCVISVDVDWEKNYVGRTDHPVSEAENVIYDDKGQALLLGKHINAPNLPSTQRCGEFIGLFKLSKAFCREYIKIFEELDKRLKIDEPFQNSKTWINAYLTDFFNELIARGHTVDCSFHKGGWQEMDTLQDHQRLCHQLMERESYAI